MGLAPPAGLGDPRPSASDSGVSSARAVALLDEEYAVGNLTLTVLWEAFGGWRT